MKQDKSPLASIVFKPDGTGHGLYTEVIDLTRLGRLKVERATAFLEKALGRISGRSKKPEYYHREELRRQQRIGQ